ncbi:hypothetical protein Mmc1_0986 [Magnetococcus marinus MC-1]|uniref:DUF4468 domain-containing protein n=1 Tax=Magnetococcus marinus (strain ATCC BAA-1437 / JCM 17883 / MC-1) TaxID=156889 RepID=A0L6B1_MAGMM|nr:hypothetical protein [Magnetococcus marinus]ABK43504.1 hypothetical protein Mmc1_0986 [Magnetococcus marinus MC-1]
MKPNFFTLFIPFILINFAQNAQAAPCATPPPPTILIQELQAKPLNIKRIPRSALIRMAGMPYVRGLTKVSKFFKSTFKFGLQRADDGTLCLYVKSLNLALGYQDTEIFMDNSYPVGSCEFRVIKLHELKHVRIYNDSLLREVGPLKRTIQHTLSSLTLRSNDRGLERSKQQLERKVGDLVKRAYRQLDHQASQENKRIDTISAYRREQQRCSQW